MKTEVLDGCSESLLHLNLLLYELLGVVNLLRGPPDGEQFEVRVAVWWRLTGNLHEGAGLLVDGLDALAAPADDEPALVSRNGEGHLSTRRPPASLASASAPSTRGHP